MKPSLLHSHLSIYDCPLENTDIFKETISCTFAKYAPVLFWDIMKIMKFYQKGKQLEVSKREGLLRK